MLLNANPGDGGRGAHPVASACKNACRLIVGFFSALMGIGGGTLSVPLLNASGRDVLRAVGTSSVFGVFIAVPATLGFMLAGRSLPDLPRLCVRLCQFIGGAGDYSDQHGCRRALGARLAHRLSKKALNTMFAGFLIVSGGRMLLAIFV